ncbi:FAD binding domain-containing protein [Cadophora sp. MPI-SDFR-AT-0126]|nr:FAD binding domain-containing protein [Leotiomycetes sp. MPI-SDFR-AT-0126]
MPDTLTKEWSQPDALKSTIILAAPLPRQTPNPSSDISRKCYEVLVVGAGPSGLMLTTALTRYGLHSDSLLCIDARPHQTLIGNADGIAARTLEILGQLGLESEFRRHGAPFVESSIWGREKTDPESLKRKSTGPFYMAPARYEQMVTLHQAHVERVFKEDIAKYGGSEVQYRSRLIEMEIDETDPEFPVLAKIERDGVVEQVRSKYLIGSDGAKSTVRSCMKVELEGDMTDELWGVIDLVPDSDFPDIRRQAGINAIVGENKGYSGGVRGGFIVPRERQPNGDFLTRLYLDMTVKEEHQIDVAPRSAEQQRQATGEKGDRITEALILERAAHLFRPYRFKVKEGTKAHWWAAFRISQSLTKSFTLKDSSSHPRVFLTGDACHSHSPRQGQGMNVSIQDSYNLAWKLAYTIFGLAENGTKLLDSYEEERLPNARNLIDFDKKMNQGAFTETKMADLKAFSTSCGIEYKEGFGISRAGTTEGKWSSQDYLNGVICPGRRLINCNVKRFANGAPRDIHDELGAEGKFSILLLAADDFGARDSRSTKTAETLCSQFLTRYPSGLIQPLIVLPDEASKFEWTDLPSCIKEKAEMTLFLASEDVYKIYGIPRQGVEAGKLIVTRPDGIVGFMAYLEDIEKVKSFLDRFIRTA